MSSPLPAPTRIRFDAFELDAASGELRKAGFLLKLQPQPFRVLLLLIERAGQVVTREEIQRCLWRESTFVDFEHGINFSINQIRGALADSSENPRYVETIPRRGYRFIGGVEQETVSTSASAVDARPSVKPVRKKHLVVACVLLLAAALALYHFWPRFKASSGPATITQINHWNKSMNDPTISPDGHSVAFVSPVGGVAQVFLMLTSGGEPLQLTNDEGDKEVDNFSPDGKEIYYGRTLGRNEVWAVPTLGGAPRHVLSANYVLPSPDGAFIYFTRTFHTEIFRAEKSGLNEEVVYNFEDTGQPFIPAPLLLFPGGNDMLAAGVRGGSSDVRIFRINLTSHKAVDLGELSSVGYGAAWAEPGKTLLFARSVNGLMNIWKYSLQDRNLTQITFGTGPDFAPMSDPGGKGIYFVNGKSYGFLTVYNVHSKESTDIVSEDATQPIISPDGKRVMYITFPTPQKQELWVSNIDGGNKLKLASGESLGTGTWAPDNFHLSFFEGDRVYIVSADSSGLRRLPLMADNIQNSVWSPDQKTIYVAGLQKGGQIPTLWRENADGSNPPEKMMDDCGFVTDTDSSGRYLLGVVSSGEKTGIYEVSISDKKCIPLFPGVTTHYATFSRDGKSFLYAVTSRREIAIYRQLWRDGQLIRAPQVALRVPFAFPLDYGGNAYDFSRDLSTIVYARPAGHADLYLLSQK